MESQPVARSPARVRVASEVPALCRKAACLLRFVPATPLKQGPSAVCFLSAAPRVRVTVPCANTTLCNRRCSVVPAVGTAVGFLLLCLLIHNGFWGGRGLSLLSVKWEHRDLSAKCVECLAGALLHVGGFFFEMGLTYKSWE